MVLLQFDFLSVFFFIEANRVKSPTKILQIFLCDDLRFGIGIRI